MSQTHQLHPHEAALKTETGLWKYTNALAKETSPYLLQHAHNPVDWHAWGPEAFELARRTDKPIFLSIGYSSCYWCHVMERLVFENPAIAAKMNEHFVNIKVDREERPDVDEIYMMATVKFTGHGGWPMSVFLTPPGVRAEDDGGLKPFFAGTYFPPEPAHRMPSFPQLIEGISTLWKDQRDAVFEQADHLAEAVTTELSHRDERGQVSPAMVQQAFNQLRGIYDSQHGGFGGAPKFPQPSNLLFVLRLQKTKPNDEMFAAVSHTLDRMARGGMYDQIGGGFHRYSTDAKWLVPHFEKMLYDNGQLVEAYTMAHELRPPPNDPGFYERVVRATCAYVLRQMTDSTGTFWSAQDAEVDAREGGTYVWMHDEFVEALRGTDAEPVTKLALTLYGLDQGTNFRDPHAPSAPPANVVYLPRPLAELAAEKDMTLAELLSAKAQIDRVLLWARDKRKQPFTDDKVLVGWNGLFIGGLAMAARVFDEPAYAQAAARAADYILANMRDDEGGLFRSMRQGTVKIPGFLEDYAMFGHGLLELHRADGNKRWLDAAEALVPVVQRRFAAPGGGYYDTLADQADLFVRTRSSRDGATSSGNSQMVINLVDLYELTGKEAYLEQALSDLESFAQTMQRTGINMVHMHHALLLAMESAPQRFANAAGAAPMTRADNKLAIKVDPDQLVVSADGTKITVTLDIAKQYHINAHQPGMDDLIPTKLILDGAEGLTMNVKYPPGEARQYPFADQAIKVYEGTITMEATVRTNGDASTSADSRLMLRYQMCTDRSCLAPQTVEVPVRFVKADR